MYLLKSKVSRLIFPTFIFVSYYNLELFFSLIFVVGMNDGVCWWWKDELPHLQLHQEYKLNEIPVQENIHHYMDARCRFEEGTGSTNTSDQEIGSCQAQLLIFIAQKIINSG